MRRLSLTLVLPAFLAALAGCGSESVVEDPDGGPTWLSALPEAGLSATPIASVGGESTYLTAVSQVALSGDSVLVVFDRNLFEAVSVRLDGAGLRRWGGVGRGPGEFQSLQAAVDGAGQIWIWDPGQGRVSRLSAFGDLLDDFPLWNQIRRTGSLVGPGDECLWFRRVALDTARVEAVGYGRGEIEAECVGRSSTSSVVRVPGMEHVDRRGAPKPVPVPFGRTSLMTSSDVDLWVTPNDSLSVERFSSSGARATLHALPALAEALPADAYRDLRDGLMTQMRKYMPDGPHLTYPDVRSFWGTPDGGGWADVSGELVRLSDSGVAVERLRRPRSRVLTATAGHLVTVRPDDEWGAPLVEVWELRASPDRPAG